MIGRKGVCRIKQWNYVGKQDKLHLAFGKEVMAINRIEVPQGYSTIGKILLDF